MLCGRSIQQSKKFWLSWRGDTGPKAIAATLSLNYGYIRRLLAEIRKKYGVHNMRELLAELETDAFADAPEIRLSPRGRDVLSLLAAGASYRQASERLGMGIGGVRRHIEKMRWQNDCESVLELIARYRARLAAEQAEASTHHR
jgi:DNA-binding CsgD family transcriptional regulator